MASSLIGILSRLAIFVCGMISLAVSRVYWELHNVDHAFGAWRIFSLALMVVGGFAVAIALLPTSWVEKAFKIRPGKHPSFVPLKMLGCFSVCSYLLSVGFYFAPRSWNPSPQLLFSICPACALAITVDVSLGTFLTLLAPLNAAVYGSVGAALGYVLVVFRNPD